MLIILSEIVFPKPDSFKVLAFYANINTVRALD